MTDIIADIIANTEIVLNDARTHNEISTFVALSIRNIKLEKSCQQNKPKTIFLNESVQKHHLLLALKSE
ncbi:hypothetical protein PM8797T_25326 [Gimesia maris DSM 8797]|nr:hypothetical protein PM8797T_25326 [Gimesia maris DSM 8797]